MTVITDNVWSNRLYNQAGTREFAQCTAWVNFDGTATPITIRDSLNVSSITDNGTGHFTVNFSAPMDNVNYSFTGSGSGTSVGIFFTPEISGFLTGSVEARSRADSNIETDVSVASVSIFGGITL